MSAVSYQVSVSPKILIVGGMPRSGTTMLKNLFNTHPDICVTGEFKTFVPLDLSYLAYLRRLRGNWWENRVMPVHITGRFQRLQRSAWNLYLMARYALALLPSAHQAVDIETIRRALHQTFPDKMVVGDKYPRYWLQLDNFVQHSGVYPVMIYRDCRDVAQSVLQKVRTQWADKPFARSIDTPEKIASTWIESINMMERHADKIFRIRYEAFVQEPEGILQELGMWLNVNPAHFKREQIRMTSIGKFRDGLTFEQIAQIEAIAGSMMERLGYV